jgi:hypothetical protein
VTPDSSLISWVVHFAGLRAFESSKVHSPA